MTTAPATHTASTPEGEPQHQAGAITLTTAQKWLIGLVITGAILIAAIGFAGSYTAVTALARQKGFGWFSGYLTLGIDIGIAVFLALDLVLAWIRMPYPVLRYTAWMLTGATIAFNAAVSWPDPLGVGMHAVIPVLFVVAVEAGRHAVGRIAQITADKHIETPPLSRWILALPSTFRLYRWMRLCNIRSYEDALRMQRDIDMYIAELKKEYGRWTWRRNADPDALLVLRFARKGIPMAEARDLPEQHRAAAEQARHDAQLAREAADEARRLEKEEAERQRRLAAEQEKRDREEAERQRRLAEEEEDRIRRLAEEEEKTELARQEAERRRLAAETEAAERAAAETTRIRIETEQRIAAAKAASAEAVAAGERRAAEARTDAERQAAEQAARAARAQADAAARVETARADDAIRQLDANRRERERQAAASRIASRPAPSASPATAGTPRPASTGNRTATSSANAPANRSASPATNTPANPTAGNTTGTGNRAANPPANANAGRAIDLSEVVATYQRLAQHLAKAPSDRELGEALGVSRSRAQQLRTAAIDAGHAQLAKPLRAA